MPPDTDKRLLLEQLRIDPAHRDEPVRSRRAPWVGASVVAGLLLIGGGIAYFVLRGPSFTVEAATAIPPSTAATGPTAILQATGYVTARRQATVSAQITGALTQVLIEEGERVSAGQVLAKLDDTAQRAALAQSVAQVQAAQALQVQYQAQLEQARRDLKRNQDLIDRHLVSQQALETAATQVKTLEAQVAAQLKQVELARAAQRGAQVQLDYTTVRAPFSGVITAKAAQAGEIVSPISAGGGFTRTGIGTLVDMDSLEVEVDVGESFIDRVRPNQPCEVRLNAYPDQPIAASVIAIIPTADRSKATVKVRVGFRQKDERILPEMGARVAFLAANTGAEKKAAPTGLLVPASAVQGMGDNASVFVVKGDKVERRPVKLGAKSGNDQTVIAGLSPGETVATGDLAKLSEGAKVKRSEN